MAPAAHTTETPSEGDLNNGAGITLGVRFTVSEGLDIGAVSFYAPATNSGTYTAGVWETDTDDDPNGSGTGTLLDSGSLASGSITPSDWNDIPLGAPVTCTPGTVYTAGVHTSSGRFVRTASFYTSNSLTGNGVTLLQAGTDPNPPGLGSMINGVFTEGGALAYPASQFNFADYFVDVALAGDEAVTGELDATLPAIETAMAGTSTAAAALTASLPTLAAVAAGTSLATAVLTTELPTLEAAAAGTANSTAVLAATLPAIFVAMADSVTAAARSTTAVTAGRTSTTAVSAVRTSTSTVG
jgi:hypothetical protein